MSMTTKLGTAAKAAVVALALGSAAFTAMPAQAQSNPPSFGFSFGNNGAGFWFGNGPNRPNRWRCMTDNQVRRMLRDRGYDEIRFTDRRGRYVTVRAERGRRDYRVTVDNCTGRIVDTDRIRGRR